MRAMETYWDWLPSFRWGLDAQEVETPTSSLFSADVLIDGLSSIVVWAASFMWRLMLWAVRASLSADLVDGAAWRVNRAAAVSSGVLLSSVLGLVAVGGAVYLVFAYVKRGNRSQIAKQAAVSVVCLGVLVGLLTAAGVSDRERSAWEAELEEWETAALAAERAGLPAPPEPAEPEPAGLSPGWWMDRTIGIVTAAGTAVGETLTLGEGDEGVAFLSSGNADASALDCEPYVAELNRRSRVVSESGDGLKNFGSPGIARAMSDLWLNASYQTFASSQYGTSSYAPQVYCRSLEAGSRQSASQQLSATVDAAAGPGCDMRYVEDETAGVWVWEWDTETGGIDGCEGPAGPWLGNRAEDILIGRPVLQTSSFGGDPASGPLSGLGYVAAAVETCASAGSDSVWKNLEGRERAACERLAVLVRNVTLGSYDWENVRANSGGGSNGDQEFGWQSMALAVCGATGSVISDAVARGGGDGFVRWSELGDASGQAELFRDTELRPCLAAMAAALGTPDTTGVLQCQPGRCPTAHPDLGVYWSAQDVLPLPDFSGLTTVTDADILESFDNAIRDSDTLGGLFTPGGPPPRTLADPEAAGVTVDGLLGSVRAVFYAFDMGQNSWVELPRLFFSLVLSGVMPAPELLLERELELAGSAPGAGRVEDFYRTYMSEALTARIYQVASTSGSLNLYQPTVQNAERAERLAFDGGGGDDFRLSELLDPSWDVNSGGLPEPVYSPTAFGQLFSPPVNYSHGVRLANFWALCVPEAPAAGEEPSAEEYRAWRDTQGDLTGLYWRVRADFARLRPLEASQAESTGSVTNPELGTLGSVFDQEWGHVCGAVWSGAAAKAGVRGYFCDSGWFDGVCNAYNQLLNRVGAGRREFVSNDITDVRPLGAGVFELEPHQVIYPSGSTFGAAPPDGGSGFAAAEPATPRSVEDAELWFSEANSRSGPGGARLTAAMVALLVTVALFVLMGVVVLMVLGAQIALLVGFSLMPLILFAGVAPSERTRKILQSSLSLLGFALVGKAAAALALSVVVLTVWVLNVLAFNLFGGIGFRWAYLMATVLSCVVILFAGRKIWKAIKHVAQETGVSQLAAKPLGAGAARLKRTGRRLGRGGYGWGAAGRFRGGRKLPSRSTIRRLERAGRGKPENAIPAAGPPPGRPTRPGAGAAPGSGRAAPGSGRAPPGRAAPEPGPARPAPESGSHGSSPRPTAGKPGNARSAPGRPGTPDRPARPARPARPESSETEFESEPGRHQPRPGFPDSDRRRILRPDAEPGPGR